MWVEGRLRRDHGRAMAPNLRRDALPRLSCKGRPAATIAEHVIADVTWGTVLTSAALGFVILQVIARVLKT